MSPAVPPTSPDARHPQVALTPGPADGHGQDLLHLLIDAVTEYAIFMLDPTGRVLTWNTGAARMKGYTAQEIIGQPFSVFYLPEEINAGKPQRELAQALAEGQSRDQGWRVRKDGTRFWANVVITPVYDADGNHQGFSKITRDETDRKTADEQVRILELLSERDRISSFLLDTVVHRIFGAGLALDSSLQSIHDAEAAGRIQDAIRTLDDTLREIRSVIFDLDHNHDPTTSA